MKYTKRDLFEASELARYNRENLANASVCGCYYCCSIFSPQEIKEWGAEIRWGEEVTAICPYCDVDSIIPENTEYPITKEFLKHMNEMWFTPLDDDDETSRSEVVHVFRDVTEKDMDMLFLEEMAASQEFLDIFLSEVEKEGAVICETEHSKTNTEYGESDITVIVNSQGKRHALLIEDKIDAKAMPRQCERYFERGRLGMEQGEYESFDVFIVAPEAYIAGNAMAREEYPNKISYERLKQYFETRTDARSSFKCQQMEQAIEKQKKGYQVQENTAVTRFWDAYIDYKEEKYPHLLLVSTKGPKGSKATWPQYNLRTWVKGVCIFHKAESGFVDISISGIAGRVAEFEEKVSSKIDLKEYEGAYITKTGKSAVIRCEVPKLNFSSDFTECIAEVEKSFRTIKRMYELADRLLELGVLQEVCNENPS